MQIILLDEETIDLFLLKKQKGNKTKEKKKTVLHL